jgi:hypothetical protein
MRRQVLRASSHFLASYCCCYEPQMSSATQGSSTRIEWMMPMCRSFGELIDSRQGSFDQVLIGGDEFHNGGLLTKRTGCQEER